MFIFEYADDSKRWEKGHESFVMSNKIDLNNYNVILSK